MGVDEVTERLAAPDDEPGRGRADAVGLGNAQSSIDEFASCLVLRRLRLPSTLSLRLFCPHSPCLPCLTLHSLNVVDI